MKGTTDQQQDISDCWFDGVGSHLESSPAGEMLQFFWWCEADGSVDIVACTRDVDLYLTCHNI